MKSLQQNHRKVRAYHRLLKLTRWIASIPDRVTPPAFRVLQIESAFWQSRALYTATRLGVADALGEARMSTHELATALGLHEDHLYRLLRMLASIGVFAETSPRVFANSRLSHCLREGHPQSVRALVLLHHSPVMAKPWMETLEACMATGETPFMKSHGKRLFEYLDQDPDFDALFAQAMDAVEALTGNAYLEDFDWGRFDRLIDVGGSRGAKAVAILARQTHLRALVFDRPQVVEHAAERWRNKVDDELLERLTFVAGDMFEWIPAARSNRDLYWFVAVFHGLDDDEARRVLANLREAIGERRPGIVVVDAVAESPGIDSNVAGFDLQMLVNTRGRERTREEWDRLFRSGGFEIAQLVAVRTFARFIVLRVT